jgi:hypothetical protein
MSSYVSLHYGDNEVMASRPLTACVLLCESVTLQHDAAGRLLLLLAVRQLAHCSARTSLTLHFLGE